MTLAVAYHTLALRSVIRGLNNAHAFITKGVAHIESQGHDPNDYLTTRLAPDMLNFTEQIQRFTDAAKSIPPNVNPDIEKLTLPDEEKTFPELLDRIKRTIAYLEGVDAKLFEGREGAEVTLKVRQGAIQITFPTLEYVTVHAQPNFWFHVVTAYDILRMKGVPLGKFDFLNGAGLLNVEFVKKADE
ncbi:hypothetical protein CC86DRAFT_156018 [Ophiobolus disseminans]|uniref:Uncharacterized protein n=1 Tax=Ophiobolus disseminans TaxID=1469910 RepID=A0A6A6ZCH2_9PLEO|nr:hypothetical protein CC86DRAFT_156018 [Ophiobolus disseminans]